MTGGSKIWTVRGIPPELQTAVSAAAKAARQTLGEWTAAALTQALSGSGRDDAAKDLKAGRFDDIEAHIAVLERRLDVLDTRNDATLARVDGFERQAATLKQRLDGFESGGGRLAAPQAPPPSPEAAAALAEPTIPQGPFTRGIGSRKRLTGAGEEELQRLLAAGVDDATIAARLGIHKRIVWARRLTERSPD
ncbi:MAG: hypothetical protein WCO00_08410 [Rhodospirillaceae bacterium]